MASLVTAATLAPLASSKDWAFAMRAAVSRWQLLELAGWSGLQACVGNACDASNASLNLVVSRDEVLLALMIVASSLALNKNPENIMWLAAYNTLASPAFFSAPRANSVDSSVFTRPELAEVTRSRRCRGEPLAGHPRISKSHFGCLSTKLLSQSRGGGTTVLDTVKKA